MQAEIAKNTYRAPAVGKAFKLMRLVAASEQGIGISEIARQLGYSKGTTHGLAQALMAEGAIFQSPVNRKFFLGSAILELTAKCQIYDRIAGKAQPALDHLRDAIDETVFLGVLGHSRAMIIATAEPARPLKISAPAGTTIPILAGAVGKAFLSAIDMAQAASIIEDIGLNRFTDHSIVDRERYDKELNHARTRGYAVDEEEYLPGVNAVAMTLQNHHGPMLALWVVGSTDAIGPHSLPGIVASMQTTTATLNHTLAA